ncbi:MAG: hypothetical protein ACRDYZ_10175 [Acidimicrobiales bacterium]
MTDVGAGETGSARTKGPRGIGGGAPASAGMAGIEWPKKAADAIEMVVDTVHDKAIRPATLIARAVVFGILVAALVAVLVVMISIAVVRILDVYVFGRQLWASYTIVGGLLTLGGLGAWSMRTVRPRSSAGR